MEYMQKTIKPKKMNDKFELRVHIPVELAKLFINEAISQRRKYGEQVAKILEERYNPTILS